MMNVIRYCKHVLTKPREYVGEQVNTSLIKVLRWPQNTYRALLISLMLLKVAQVKSELAYPAAHGSPPARAPSPNPKLCLTQRPPSELVSETSPKASRTPYP